MFDDHHEKKRHQLILEKVSKAMREDPKNWPSQMDRLGFTWFDDEDDQEEIEENEAIAENLNQEFLLAYFEGHVGLTDRVLNAYQHEKDSDSPNYPLIRRYFKEGNENLKELILLGLGKNPTDSDLLSDLGFFHEYNDILADLIRFYLAACVKETDLSKFEHLVLNFFYDTAPDGFDALQELRQRFDPCSDKRRVINKIIDQHNSEPECIAF